MIKKNENILNPDIENVDDIEEIIDEINYVYVDKDSDEETTNTIGEVFQALKRAILRLRNVDKTPYFKTVAIDTGQVERLIHDTNTEYETPFPACFIRFVDVHFLVSQQRIGEGRCTCRIRFLLNRLDNQDVEWETFPFYIAEKVNAVIQAAKETEPALMERCNLTYFDMPQTTNMLQAYWLDYEVYFKISSSEKYQDWIQRQVIHAPFTNNDDAGNQKPNVDKPTYAQSSKLNIIKTS